MKTRDKYEGCLPQIAEALKAGLQVEAWVWDNSIDKAEQHYIENYIAGRVGPYIVHGSAFIKASLTDPRKPAKPPIEGWIGKWGYYYDNPELPLYGVLDKLMVGTEYPFRRRLESSYAFFVPADLITNPDPATWADITYSSEDIGGGK